MELQGSGKDKKEKAGISMVDLAYRRAKAVKAKQKALDAGKIVKSNGKKSKHSSQESNSRAKEMRELFHSDMSEKKQKRTGGIGKKPKHSFKSKSRYELAYNSFPCFGYFLCSSSSCLLLAQYYSKLAIKMWRTEYIKRTWSNIILE